MPRKPTEEFGHIRFGKSGSVSKEMSRLSNRKDEQEAEIGTRFAKALTQELGITVTSEPLPERGHDVQLKVGHQGVELQLTEIVRRDYSTEVSRNEAGRNPLATTSMPQADGSFLEFDDERLADIFVLKIAAKLKKHYQVPTQNRLWLCIWDTDPYTNPTYHRAGVRTESEAMQRARTYCTVNPPWPFDEIWYFSPEVPPQRIWPAPAAQEIR